MSTRHFPAGREKVCLPPRPTHAVDVYVSPSLSRRRLGLAESPLLLTGMTSTVENQGVRTTGKDLDSEGNLICGMMR